MSVKQEINIFKKMYDILLILVDFCGNLRWFWLIFCYPDSDPADQNETDPNVSESETLLLSNMFLISGRTGSLSEGGAQCRERFLRGQPGRVSGHITTI